MDFSAPFSSALPVCNNCGAALQPAFRRAEVGIHKPTEYAAPAMVCDVRAHLYADRRTFGQEGGPSEESPAQPRPDLSRMTEQKSPFSEQTPLRDRPAEGPVRTDPWFRPLCALFGALVVAWITPRLLVPAQIQFRLHWWALGVVMLLFIAGLVGLAHLSTTGWITAWMIGMQAFAAGLLASGAVLAPVVRGGGAPWIVPVILLAFPASLGALACEGLFRRVQSRRSPHLAPAKDRRTRVRHRGAKSSV